MLGNGKMLYILSICFVYHMVHNTFYMVLLLITVNINILHILLYLTIFLVSTFAQHFAFNSS